MAIQERRSEMIDLRERLVVIESKCLSHETNIEVQSEILKGIQEDVQKIAVTMASNKGFFGGIVFAVSGIWVVLLVLLNYLTGKH